MSLVWQDPDSRAKSKPETRLPLFEQAHARNSDGKHSHEAAKSVSLNTASLTKNAIINCLAIRPCTDEEIAAFFKRVVSFPVSPSGLRSRRSELVRMGFVVEAGEGVTASGRKCSIWRLA